MKEFKDPTLEIVSLLETDKIMTEADYGWELLASGNPLDLQ